MQRIILETHYGAQVWTNPFTDTIRPHECLCLHCERLVKGDKAKNCSIAQQVYELAVQNNCAMIMSRCQQFIPKAGVECDASPAHKTDTFDAG